MWDPSEEYINGTGEGPRKPSAFIAKLTKLFESIASGVLIFAFMGFLVLIPILFDFSQANTFGRIAMIAGTVYALPVLLLAILITSFPSSFWKNLFYFAPFIIAYIVGIVAYFKNDLWGLKSFFLGLFISYIMLIGIFESIRILFDKTFENDRSSIVLISTAIVTILIAKINETQNNLIASDLFYKIGIGIAYLMGIAIYAHVCLQGKLSTSHPIRRILGIVFWGALITITFPFYVQWCGLKGNDFNTFVSVYSAFLGGALTLAGVAWTIRKMDKDRKEEAKNKYKPIINFGGNNTNISGLFIDGKKFNGVENNPFENTEKEKSAYTLLNLIGINTDWAPFYWCGIILNQERYYFSVKSYIDKNECFGFLGGTVLYVKNKNFRIYLILQDLLGNEYKLPTKFDVDEETNKIVFKDVGFVCDIDTEECDEQF